MLLQITNQCFEGCHHCMQDSNPDGGHMSQEVFDATLSFIKKVQPFMVLVTGGEPFCHPHLYDYCKALSDADIKFMVLTNGVHVVKYEKSADIYKRISELGSFYGYQVYTNNDFYKDYDLVISNSVKFGKFLTDFPIQNMQDLGRAKTCKKAQEQINPHFSMSCVNGNLMARQTTSFHSLVYKLECSGKFCHPLIDFQGNVHLSESWLCPHFGNVTESPVLIFERMQKSKPCMGCRNSKNFLVNPRYQAAISLLSM